MTISFTNSTWTGHFCALAVSFSLMIILAHAPAVHAQTNLDPTTQASTQSNPFVSKDQLVESSRRMGLTPEQQEAIRPIMDHSLQQRVAAMEKHGIDPNGGEKPNFITLLALKFDMDRITRDTRHALSKHLSREQLAIYDQIVKERQKEVSKRFK